MVLKIEGQVAQQRPNRSWLIWTGPVTLAAFFILANLYAMSRGELALAAFQFASMETAGLLVVFLPFLRLVRDVNVGPYGIEAHFYRGSARYLRWSEIDSIIIHIHAFIPSRIRLEDVYGRRLYPKGEPARLAPVLRARGRKGLRPQG
ncbi:hypothetical protein BH23ACT12_BH23ACT12_22680 [soil metagenome]